MSNSNKPQETKPQDLEAILKRLEAAEKRAAEADAARKLAEEELAAQREQSGLRVLATEEAYRGPGGGYRFEIKPKSPREGLSSRVITACDETEALRVYVATTEWPPNSGKQLDTVAVPLAVKCLDEAVRKGLVAKYHRIARLRGRVEAGASLSEDDLKFLDEFEAEQAELAK